jgi:hypothetical protein
VQRVPEEIFRKSQKLSARQGTQLYHDQDAITSQLVDRFGQLVPCQHRRDRQDRLGPNGPSPPQSVYVANVVADAKNISDRSLDPSIHLSNEPAPSRSRRTDDNHAGPCANGGQRSLHLILATHVDVAGITGLIHPAP